MLNLSFNTAMGFLLAVLLWSPASALAQPGGPTLQQRVTGTCPPGQSIRVINANGSVVCEVDDNSGGTVTSVSTGAGLTGGPITTSGTISIATGGVTSAHIADGTIGALDVNPGQVQLRVTGSCGPGNAIRVVDQSGAVTCQSVGSGTVTAVTASAPLVSSGGTTPNISLPNVILDSGLLNTAIGPSALQSNTSGFQNTAVGVDALRENTVGFVNTAIGIDALRKNTDGIHNAAMGAGALRENTVGTQNTASGWAALLNNTTGNDNTASGAQVLQSNTTGVQNTAIGVHALIANTTGIGNTASGVDALISNTTGSDNTGIGHSANVSSGNLTNATAIGAGAVVDASNKVRLGNNAVTVIEGEVPFTFSSDMTKKENFQPVDGEEVLRKLSGLSLTSWNYIGHDPKQFRHYGPMGQEFFAAFGHDAIGTIGSPTTLTASDVAGILMSAVQALERRSEEQRAALETLRAENAALQGRLQALEPAVQAKEALAQR
jgi:endosialidase-like protein